MTRPLFYSILGLAVSTAVAHGQSSGTFGNRSVGSSFSSRGSSFGGGGFGSAFPGSGLPTGAGGSLAGATTRGDDSVGMVTGNERFVRDSRRPGTFVGADSADSQNFMSQLGALSVGATLGRLGAGGDPNRNLNQSRTSRSPARVQTVLGFTPPSLPVTKVTGDLQARLQKSPRIQRRGPIEVRLEGRTAVLSGVVATEHDRALAERVALLEAGVSQVRNELRVDAPTSPPTTLPTVPEAVPGAKP